MKHQRQRAGPCLISLGLVGIELARILGRAASKDKSVGFANIIELWRQNRPDQQQQT